MRRYRNNAQCPVIATAKRSIDFASYALTDPIILDALNEAERRGG
jgi:phosphatidylserine/phosphatidylglycerophosphate/cardiolipin synthase-like enzyme